VFASGNPSNSIDANLAVLCVEDHDHHHRPSNYASKPNHTELGATEILKFKTAWEQFMMEARQPAPKVIATLSAYGTLDLIHSLQLVLQWPDETIAFKESYHLLDGNLDRLTDKVFADMASIGPNIKMVVINEPLPVEHCPCCGSGVSRTTKPAVVKRLTDPNWATDSLACIYINPDQASLAITLFFQNEEILSSSLHLCQGRYLHYHNEWLDDRVPVTPRPSIRTQAVGIVKHVLREWRPARTLIGTGDPEKPELISDLILPVYWEARGGRPQQKDAANVCHR
jgi:hypothetical protein